MDNAVPNSQRGRDEPVSVGGHRRILAQVQCQFGEHGALDFLKVVILHWRGNTLRWGRLASEPSLIRAHAFYAAISRSRAETFTSNLRPPASRSPVFHPPASSSR